MRRFEYNEVDYLTQCDSVNIVSIKVPVFKKEETNTLLKEHIEQYFYKCYGKLSLSITHSENDVEIDYSNHDYTGYLIDLDFLVTYNSEYLISVIFKGICNYKKAAHPNNVLIAFNINPQNGESVSFSDRYNVTKDLYNEFAELSVESISQSAQGGVYPSEWGDFSESICSWEFFSERIKAENEIYTYFTDEGVSIVYPVSHSAGDYLITQIPYDNLKPYKK